MLADSLVDAVEGAGDGVPREGEPERGRGPQASPSRLPAVSSEVAGDREREPSKEPTGDGVTRGSGRGRPPARPWAAACREPYSASEPGDSGGDAEAIRLRLPGLASLWAAVRALDSTSPDAAEAEAETEEANDANWEPVKRRLR